MNELTISGVSVRQDEQGRFCLNDLHRAAGEEKRHQPSDWLRIQQTQELINEVEIPGIPGIVSKQGLGTFVVKELVYAYAMWISPKFHLQVIRAYDQGKKAIALPDFGDPAIAARAWADEFEQKMIALNNLEEAERQRDIALQTKAEIGSRREATAMATASAATRKANALEIELDRSRDYCTIKRMQMIYHGMEFNWRALKQASIEMGVLAVDVFDQNYGKVKAYHRDVWRETYALEF